MSANARVQESKPMSDQFTVLTTWLALRQEVLISMNSVNKIPPFDDAPYESDATLLKTFCDVLLDYLTQGHMQFIKQLQGSLQSCSQQKQHQIQQLIKKLEKNTQSTFFGFTEKQQHPVKEINASIKASLNQVAEQLTDRIDIEDQLISILMKTS